MLERHLARRTPIGHLSKRWIDIGDQAFGAAHPR